MNKEEIIIQLQKTHQQFIETVLGLDDDAFMFAWQGEKWTAGQQLLHIYQSVAPLNKFLSAKATDIKTMFGIADNPSKNYAELVESYNTALGAGVTIASNFFPKSVELAEREAIIEKLKMAVSTLTSLTAVFSEQEIEEISVPHPLLGKLTLREMLYFTIHHATHHHKMTNLSLNAYFQIDTSH